MSFLVPTTTILQYLDTFVRAAASWTRRNKPLSIYAEELPSRDRNEWSIVTSQKVGKGIGPSGLSGFALRQWFVRRFDCVSTHDCIVRVTLTNRVRATVSILDVRAAVSDVSPPLSGTRIDHPTAGASDVEALFVDLDSPEAPTLHDVSVEQEPTDPYFLKRFIRLSPNESVVLLIRAHTQRSCITWRPQMTVRVGSSSLSKTQESDQYFKVSAASPHAECFLWGWWLQLPRLVTEREATELE